MGGDVIRRFHSLREFHRRLLTLSPCGAIDSLPVSTQKVNAFALVLSVRILIPQLQMRPFRVFSHAIVCGHSQQYECGVGFEAVGERGAKRRGGDVFGDVVG